MSIDALRKWTARLLFGFILITIGFSLGRRTAPPMADSGFIPESQEQPASLDQVVVYAAHMTFRCPECTQIEWYARELVETEFADEMADGRLVFRTVDYMRDSAFARRYNISSSTIVVTRADSDEFQRLDEVWTMISKREEYFDYVRTAIRESLEIEGGS